VFVLYSFWLGKTVAILRRECAVAEGGGDDEEEEEWDDDTPRPM
jgi:hypothetical protein